VTQLVCPFCGPRELREFEFRKTVPSSGTTGFARVYLRVDHMDRSVEHWQHVQGCRAWLVIERDPRHDTVLSVRLAGTDP
jgi:methylglutamate dehydrogenase subunit B